MLQGKLKILQVTCPVAQEMYFQSHMAKIDVGPYASECDALPELPGGCLVLVAESAQIAKRLDPCGSQSLSGASEKG